MVARHVGWIAGKVREPQRSRREEDQGQTRHDRDRGRRRRWKPFAGPVEPLPQQEEAGHPGEKAQAENWLPPQPIQATAERVATSPAVPAARPKAEPVPAGSGSLRLPGSKHNVDESSGRRRPRPFVPGVHEQEGRADRGEPSGGGAGAGGAPIGACRHGRGQPTSLQERLADAVEQEVAEGKGVRRRADAALDVKSGFGHAPGELLGEVEPLVTRPDADEGPRANRLSSERSPDPVDGIPPEG